MLLYTGSLQQLVRTARDLEGSISFSQRKSSSFGVYQSEQTSRLMASVIHPKTEALTSGPPASHGIGFMPLLGSHAPVPCRRRPHGLFRLHSLSLSCLREIHRQGQRQREQSGRRTLATGLPFPTGTHALQSTMSSRHCLLDPSPPSLQARLPARGRDPQQNPAAQQEGELAGLLPGARAQDPCSSEWESTAGAPQGLLLRSGTSLPPPPKCPAGDSHPGFSRPTPWDS